jgi:hypothetical protein
MFSLKGGRRRWCRHKMPLLLLWYRLYFGILGRGTAKGLSLALCVNCLFFA